MQRLIYFFSFIVLGVLLFFALSLWFVRPNEPTRESSSNGPSLAVRTESPITGSRQAPVIIQVFSSYTCPACKETADTLAQIRALYPTEVAVVHRDYPFDTDEARLLAQAGRCAQLQGRFWPYHDLLFANQGRGSSQGVLLDYAERLGLRQDVFQKCLTENETVPAIEQDIADAAFLKIDSLPYFDVNNKVRASGHVDLAQWQTIISDLK